MKILVGADPEVFVKKDGSFVSAHGMIPGTKKDPFRVEKGAVQVDGMALEFNIDPAGDEEEFLVNIRSVFSVLESMVQGYEIHAVPVADFPLEYIRAQPEEAKELGCDPDYNGWTLAANDKPDAELPMRTASGHVHIGWDESCSLNGGRRHMREAAKVARQMDFYLALPSLFYDEDTRRRSMYGKAGCMRVKPYGMEYRTLSNKWLTKDSLVKWVFNQVQEGMQALKDGFDLSEKFGDIQEIINTSNKKAAESIMNMAGIKLEV